MYQDLYFVAANLFWNENYLSLNRFVNHCNFLKFVLHRRIFLKCVLNVIDVHNWKLLFYLFILENSFEQRRFGPTFHGDIVSKRSVDSYDGSVLFSRRSGLSTCCSKVSIKNRIGSYMSTNHRPRLRRNHPGRLQDELHPSRISSPWRYRHLTNHYGAAMSVSALLASLE